MKIILIVILTAIVSSVCTSIITYNIHKKGFGMMFLLNTSGDIVNNKEYIRMLREGKTDYVISSLQYGICLDYENYRNVGVNVYGEDFVNTDGHAIDGVIYRNSTESNPILVDYLHITPATAVDFSRCGKAIRHSLLCVLIALVR